MKKKLEIKDLETIYSSAESVDKPIFSEQRSNVLLVSGDHYTRRGSRFWDRIRSNTDLSKDQKIRITKNHIQAITKTYINNITSYAPSVAVIAKNSTELQDEKAAELHNSVWQHLRSRHRLREKTRAWVKDFVEIGEVAVKVFWDESAGDFLGYHQATDPLTGAPLMDEMGQPEASETPGFSGDLKYEPIYCFNLLRAPEAKTMQDSRFLIIRKMVNVEDLKAKVAGDEDKVSMVEGTADETFMVFDGGRGMYHESKDECLVKEYYFRPCAEYPMGYFYITTAKGILFEGELPFGVFPIIYAGFDGIATTPRHHSIIKQLRPYQAEINRASSKVAEHQITLGDDKIIYAAGSKIANGGSLPGIRGVQISGQMPTILAGRSGDQYLPYIQAQIDEMYKIALVAEDSIEINSQLDPTAMLFMSMRQRKKYSSYAEKIEQFLIDICDVSLRLMKQYCPDDMIIQAVGRSEQINIPEFKNSKDIGYQIKLEPQSDDIETKLGKQLSIQHILQYSGANLQKEDIGMLARNLPFVDGEELFEDLTIQYDNAKNTILALDRGQPRQPMIGQDNKYMIKKLSNRMIKPDFEFLDPNIQSLYQQTKGAYEQAETDEQMKLKQAESEFIPTGGGSVKIDFYVPDPSNPMKQMRATAPGEAIQWLLKTLEAQGSSQEALQQIQQGTLAEMADMFVQKSGGGGGQPPQQPGMTIPH